LIVLITSFGEEKVKAVMYCVKITTTFEGRMEWIALGKIHRYSISRKFKVQNWEGLDKKELTTWGVFQILKNSKFSLHPTLTSFCTSSTTLYEKKIPWPVLGFLGLLMLWHIFPRPLNPDNPDEFILWFRESDWSIRMREFKIAGRGCQWRQWSGTIAEFEGLGKTVSRRLTKWWQKVSGVENGELH